MRSLILTSVLLSTTALPALAQNVLPTDADQTCAVSSADLDGWFASGQASAGGLVKPANGFNFPPSATNTKCDFYKWGAQMYLWLTSPTGTDEIVLDSGLFFDTIKNSSGTFDLEMSGGATANTFAVRAIKGDETITGAGQAGGGDVLLSQSGSLVYYGIHVNDIYAYFQSGYSASPNAFEGTSIQDNFPTTSDDVTLIQNYARKSTGNDSLTFTDFDASTMELKTSWVDASKVTNQDEFVLINAAVPEYTSNAANTVWTPTTDAQGNLVLEEKTLAMVGLHIAAPVLGHPELVWISYEHLSSAPMAEYVYTDNATPAAIKTMAFSGTGNWTFLPANGSEASVMTPVASVASEAGTGWDGTAYVAGDIVAADQQTIEAIDVTQINPWGVAPGSASDPVADNNNAALIALNVSVNDVLSGLSDVRANYYQIGGIWTVDGQLPTSGTDGNIRGGDQLANSTMETFHQFPNENGGFVSNNCFTCHSVKSTDTHGVDLSHIFTKINPLP